MGVELRAGGRERAAAQVLVESFLGALSRMDLDEAMSMLALNAEYQNVPLPPVRGLWKIERTLRAMMRPATAFEVRMHHIAASEDVVLTERTDIITGPWLDLRFWVCGTFQVRHGKIVLWRDYFDAPTFAWQLATSPLRALARGRWGRGGSDTPTGR